MGGDVHALAMSGAIALAGDRAGTLTAFDAATGAVRWSATFPGALWSAPRVDTATGAVVATWHQTDTPAVRVLDLRTGAPRWEAATATSTAAPVLGRGVVVLAIGDGHRHARVEARDLATGERRWQTPVPASFEEAIEPAVDAGAVAVVDHFGVVSLLDLATGRIRWQHDLAHALIATRMALTARRVVFSSFSGELFVLDRADGHLVTQLGRDRLGGYPVALRRAPWGPPARLLVALRLGRVAGRPAADPLRRRGSRPLHWSPTRARGPGSRTPAFRGHQGPPRCPRAEDQPRSSSSGPATPRGRRPG